MKPVRIFESTHEKFPREECFSIEDLGNGRLLMTYADAPNGHVGCVKVSADEFAAAMKDWLAKST